MKNQYFGDINDYRKYGLLRLLSGGGQVTTALCWMLTPDDGQPDGGRIRYLQQPGKWRRFDPKLYDCLRNLVIEREVRNVRALEDTDTLRSCRFHSEIIPDDEEDRREYFQRFLDLALGSELVFFDPDNGIEVKSVPYGRRRSSKYLYWHEVVSSFSAGHSVLIYQHFPRIPRERFIRARAREFGEHIYTTQVYSYRTPHVVFFLVSQVNYTEFFERTSAKVASAWESQIEVEKHQFA